jgi:LPXTG-site transpeptidase (sortase) family protein
MMMHSAHRTDLNLTRRSLLALGPAALGVLTIGSINQDVATANAPVEGNARGDMPTTGGMRPGPVGLNPTKIRRKGVTPVAMKITKAEVDAQVEAQPIQDGVMLDPSGPFVIAWYEDTGKLGQETNLVFAGHLDYYNVGQAVFYHLGALDEGDEIQITGENEEIFTYTVEWARQYTVDELDSGAIQEIVGKTQAENVSLITCGGEFDYNVGQYLQRYVVRAKRSG